MVWAERAGCKWDFHKYQREFMDFRVPKTKGVWVRVGVCETFSYNICAEVETENFPIGTGWLLWDHPVLGTVILKQHLQRKEATKRRKNQRISVEWFDFCVDFAETQHAEAAGPEHCHDGDVAGGAERAVAAGAVRGLPAQRGAPLLPAGGVREPCPGAPHRGAQGGALSHPQLHDWCQEALHALLRAWVSVCQLLAPSPLAASPSWWCWVVTAHSALQHP